MFEIKITFNDELVDFFSKTSRKKVTKFIDGERRSVKDLIESVGIPHTELGQILVNGKSVDFSFVIQEQCQIDVYPFKILNHSAGDFILKKKFRFLCDVHLGTLTKRLRLLGLDTAYNQNWHDKKLAEVSIKERRYLLTRDRQLLMRKRVSTGLYVRNTNSEKQVFEVVNRLNLKFKCKPFTRCLVCNGILRPIKNIETVFEKTEKIIPPKVKQWCREYALCKTCDKVYWKGSHFKKLKKMVDFYLN